MIVEQLEKELKLATREKERCISENPMQFEFAKGYEMGLYNALEIVRDRKKDENSNWIQCNKRLPNEEEMKRAYCRNHYGSEFIVMIKGATKPTTLYRTIDGFWVDEKRITYTVLAWQPLPNAYVLNGKE